MSEKRQVLCVVVGVAGMLVTAGRGDAIGFGACCVSTYMMVALAIEVATSR